MLQKWRNIFFKLIFYFYKTSEDIHILK